MCGSFHWVYISITLGKLKVSDIIFLNVFEQLQVACRTNSFLHCIPIANSMIKIRTVTEASIQLLYQSDTSKSDN